MNTHDIELTDEVLEQIIRESRNSDGTLKFARRIARAAIEADRKRRVEPVDIPVGWKEQFREAVYENLAAADNQDIPLEEYPDRILEVLETVVGPRHPTVVKWRNDAIRTCLSIAHKYCRDADTQRYLKQDLEALITAAPQPAEPAKVPSDADILFTMRHIERHLKCIDDAIPTLLSTARALLARYRQCS